jgi:hypothetical protein
MLNNASRNPRRSGAMRSASAQDVIRALREATQDSR